MHTPKPHPRSTLILIAGKTHSDTNQNKIYAFIIFRHICPVIQGIHWQNSVFTYSIKQSSSEDRIKNKLIPVQVRIRIFPDFALSKPKNIPHLKEKPWKRPKKILQKILQTPPKTGQKEKKLWTQKQPSPFPTLTPRLPVKKQNGNYVRVKITGKRKSALFSSKKKPKISPVQQKPRISP